MPNTNTNLQLKASFYHSLSKVITEDGNLAGNELYKSAPNIRSNDVWLDEIPYSPTYASASSISNEIVLQIGTISNPLFLYPLKNTNYQTWFLDTGTPSSVQDGFEPSDKWAKPLINPSDVPNKIGAPSMGFSLKMYRKDGLTEVTYNNSYYEVDYYAGLIRFQLNSTPKDMYNGLGFTFNTSEFELSNNKLNYIKSTTTGGPRAIAFKYVGRKLSDINFDNIGLSYSEGSGISIINNNINVNIDNDTIKFNNDNKLYVDSNIISQQEIPNNTFGDQQPTGIIIGNNISTLSPIEVYVYGQIYTIGDGVTSSNCYFYDGVSVSYLNNVKEGDELYWNGLITGFDLDNTDVVLISYVATT